MIIVRNRELLIPNNERNIGTTFDSESENRVFELPRFASNGVDLGNLTFKLDLEYANGFKDTADLDINSIDGIVINEEGEEEKPEDICIEQHPHPHMHFHHHHCDKPKDEWKVVLTWHITPSVVQVGGTVKANLRASDINGTVKWASFIGTFYVEDTINTPASPIPEQTLTELEQLENKVNAVLATEESRVIAENAREQAEVDRASAEEVRDAQETVRAEAETTRAESFEESMTDWESRVHDLEEGYDEASLMAKSYAVGGTGTREGEDTDNAKYYKEQAQSISVGSLHSNGDKVYFGDTATGTDDGEVSNIIALSTSDGVSRSYKFKDTQARSDIETINGDIDTINGDIDDLDKDLADLKKEVEDAGIDNAVLGDLNSTEETEIPVLSDADLLGGRITAEDVEGKVGQSDVLSFEEYEASSPKPDTSDKVPTFDDAYVLSQHLVNNRIELLSKNYSTDSIKVVKNGNICFLNIITDGRVHANNEMLGVLPIGCRPIDQTYFSGFTNSTNTTGVDIYVVETDGTIKISRPHNRSEAIRSITSTSFPIA